MGPITLQIPALGAPNSTEDAKVASDFTTVQTVINGGLDDTNLASPNNGVRRLLLTSSGLIKGLSVGPGNQVFRADGTMTTSGTTFGTVTSPVPMWVPDAGLSSQPQDFQVAAQTAYGRVRVAVAVNNTAPGINYTFGLYQLTNLGSGSGGSDLTYLFGSALTGSTIALNTPAGGTAYGIESGEFPLPVTGAGNPYMLGVNLSSIGLNPNSVVGVTAQLYGYNHA